jgi:hypothetical protein
VDEAKSVRPRVVRVDAEDDDAAPAVLPPELLEIRRLPFARPAPRGEEVEDDRLAAEGREREVAASAQPSQREGWSEPTHLRRRRLVREVPDQQRSEHSDPGGGHRLRSELQPAAHAR